MRGLMLCLFAEAILAAGLARAEIREFSLPDLDGVYTCQPSPSRSVNFGLDPAPALVRSVSIRLSGETNVREWFCDLDPPFPLPVTLYVAIPDPVTGGEWYTYGTAPRVTGAFEMTLKFHPYAPQYFGEPSWDFLSAGSGRAVVYGGGAPIIDICWPIGDLSDARVSGAFLVIDGEFPVPVEPTSWGRIKSLFDE